MKNNKCTCDICGIKTDDLSLVEFDTVEKVIEMNLCDDCTIRLIEEISDRLDYRKRG